MDGHRVEPPPLHELDAHHAVTLQAIDRWVREVYPSVHVTEHDRTRQWNNCAVTLFQTLAVNTDQSKAVAYLSQVCAELLLAHAERVTGRA